jgi:hypothetical protein
LRGAWLVFPGPEVAAKKWNDAKRAEKSIADTGSCDFFGAGNRLEGKALRPIDTERSKGTILPLPVEVVRIRNVVAVTHRDAFEESY